MSLQPCPVCHRPPHEGVSCRDATLAEIHDPARREENAAKLMAALTDAKKPGTRLLMLTPQERRVLRIAAQYALDNCDAFADEGPAFDVLDRILMAGRLG